MCNHPSFREEKDLTTPVESVYKTSFEMARVDESKAIYIQIQLFHKINSKLSPLIRF